MVLLLDKPNKTVSNAVLIMPGMKIKIRSGKPNLNEVKGITWK